MMGEFGRQSNPFDGPDFETWDVRKDGASSWIQQCVSRRDRFAGGIDYLKRGLTYLRQARGQVSPGAQHELEYLIFKTETYISHLQTIRAFLGGFIAYDAAFRAKQKKDEKQMLDQFDMCEFLFSETRDQVLKTVKQLAASAFVEDPTEKYLLFRYNVRFVLPIEQFGKFIKNVVNFHHGQPYWERVDWGLIAPRDWMNP